MNSDLFRILWWIYFISVTSIQNFYRYIFRYSCITWSLGNQVFRFSTGFIDVILVSFISRQCLSSSHRISGSKSYSKCSKYFSLNTSFAFCNKKISKIQLLLSALSQSLKSHLMLDAFWQCDYNTNFLQMYFFDNSINTKFLI